jgi:double-strand break repair protein MRE11
MSSEEEEIPPSPSIAEVDDDMLRVLVSTDNHLGYCERDPVRGLDSFAAFEEVLYLARQHKVSITSVFLCVC